MFGHLHHPTHARNAFVLGTESSPERAIAVRKATANACHIICGSSAMESDWERASHCEDALSEGHANIRRGCAGYLERRLRAVVVVESSQAVYVQSHPASR